MEGWISLYRKFIKWEWYKNHNVKCLFIHFLLRANHEEGTYQGQVIKRGQLITGLHQLELETGLTTQQIRTAISKLISTNEITSKSTNKNRLITILKYDDYQTTNKQNNKQLTSNQQATNKQLTTNNNVNKKNNVNNSNKTLRFTKPTIDEIDKYCKERKNNIDANNFFNYYESKGWKVGSSSMKNWKAAIRTWENRNKLNTTIPNDINSSYNPEEAIDDLKPVIGITVRDRKQYAIAHNLALDSVMKLDGKIIQEYIKNKGDIK